MFFLDLNLAARASLHGADGFSSSPDNKSDHTAGDAYGFSLHLDVIVCSRIIPQIAKDGGVAKNQLRDRDGTVF